MILFRRVIIIEDTNKIHVNGWRGVRYNAAIVANFSGLIDCFSLPLLPVSLIHKLPI